MDASCAILVPVTAIIGDAAAISTIPVASCFVVDVITISISNPVVDAVDINTFLAPIAVFVPMWIVIFQRVAITTIPVAFGSVIERVTIAVLNPVVNAARGGIDPAVAAVWTV